MREYDVVVIGAGSAGLVACKLANGLGKKTALVEKRKIGGDCTWFGCIPSKTLIKSAKVAHDILRMRQFGLDSSVGSFELNGDNVMKHVRAVVQSDADGHPAESYEAEGINVLFGSPKFLDSHRIELEGRVISAKKFIICTGSHPGVPDIPGLEEVEYLTNETVFDLDRLPESMLVLGGGPIGIELSAALNRLGVDVTVLQRSGQVLKKDDPELVERLLESLRGEGLKILTNTKTTQVSSDGDMISVTIEDDQGVRQIQAEALLVATGRKPNLDGLDLEKASVQYDKSGVIVNSHLQSTAKNIYAAGDVVPPYLFTHIADYEAVVATTNACFGLPLKKVNYENVLWTTYTDPELAHAGLTEAEARELYGESVRVYRWDHANVDRGKTDLATNGLSKFICDKKGKLLGIHILGHGAGELMHEAQLIRFLNKPFYKLAGMIHAYPSYSDSVRQPAKRCYIDQLRNNPFLKFVKALTDKKNRLRLILLGVVVAIVVGLFIAAGDKLTLENIQANGDKLRAFSDSHYVGSILIFILVYIVAVGFNVPGGTILTLTAGFLYGVLAGAVYVNLGATAGATCAFLFARYIAGSSLQARYADRLEKFNSELDRNGAQYLLTLRFIPAVPFFLINLFAGLTKIRLRTFVWTTAVGIFPGSLVFTYAGRQMATIKSVGDIFTPRIYGAFILLIALALIPVIYTKYKDHKAQT